MESSGLNTYTKRYRVSTYIRRMGIRIATLQETHLGKGESQKLKKKWRGQLYSSTYSSYARGVSIWVAPQVPFRLLSHRADVELRYILVHGTLDGVKLCMLNIYAPNIDDKDFFAPIENELLDYIGVPLIWAGDFN